MSSFAPLVLPSLASIALLMGACTSTPPAAPASTNSDASREATSMVDASVVVGACPDARKMNAKAANDTITKLVERCTQVPGGKAHFSATLKPDGKIEIASPEGNAADGVVPMCVLTHGLTHRVVLSKPCRLDVQLEERKLGRPPP